MIVMSFIRVYFFPDSPIVDEVLASLGAGLFCLFVVHDTQMIMKKLSPEEYIVASIELYLDIINLFLKILRIMGKNKKKKSKVSK